MNSIIPNKKAGSIITYSGVWMDPLHPQENQIHIEDIAHSLSMMCRANGHFKTFHSVAQHCMECYEEAKTRGMSFDVQRFCFFHDAAEAYLGDFVSPVKYRMEDYKEAENQLLHAVYRKYVGRVPTDAEERQVKLIDHTLLYYEFEALMGVPIGEEPAEGLKSGPSFEERYWKDVESDYLAMFDKIKKCGLNQESRIERI